jgi:hypothetical protein
LIALAHSIVFLGIALHGFASPKAGVLFHGVGATADLILIASYLTVASILAWLVSIARSGRERAYFALCAGSATFGLVRTIFGDAALPVAQYLRVIMLTSAVVMASSHSVEWLDLRESTLCDSCHSKMKSNIPGEMIRGCGF